MKKLALITTLLLLTGFTAAQTSSQIQIDLKNTEPTPLQTSEYADIWLEVTNTGGATAENINIQFNENYPFSVVRGDKKNWSINELVPGDTYQLHLQTRVDSNAVQGNNTLNFNIETERLTFEEKVPVEIRSDRNIIAIRNVDFPDTAAPGSNNEMQLTLENLADSQAKNIQVGLDLSQELPIATKESADKNLVNIPPGQTQQVSYTLKVDESAENGVYKIPVNIEFENEAGTEFTQETTTGITVGGTPNLEAALNTENQLTNGKTTDLTFRLVNRGHGSADFVSMKINDTNNVEVIGTEEVYIGSMDSDDFQTATFKININAETESINTDTIQFPVQLSYTDSEGQKTETQTVQAELYTQEQLQQYGLANTGSATPIILLLVILVVGGAYYWRKRRKE